MKKEGSNQRTNPKEQLCMCAAVVGLTRSFYSEANILNTLRLSKITHGLCVDSDSLRCLGWLVACLLSRSIDQSIDRSIDGSINQVYNHDICGVSDVVSISAVLGPYEINLHPSNEHDSYTFHRFEQTIYIDIYICICSYIYIYLRARGFIRSYGCVCVFSSESLLLGEFCGRALRAEQL